MNYLCPLGSSSFGARFFQISIYISAAVLLGFFRTGISGAFVAEISAKAPNNYLFSLLKYIFTGAKYQNKTLNLIFKKAALTGIRPSRSLT